MRTRVHPVWVVTIAALCVVGGTLLGYEIRGPGTAPAGPPRSGSGSPVLSITAAGTLGTAFPALADILVNESPGAEAPIAAQVYEGSLAALDLVTQPSAGYDVAASVDYRLIPQMLVPAHASWEVLFASNPEVLTYDPSVPALAGINSSNWAEKLQSPGIVLGVANASVDPNGYNEIFVLELQGLLENLSEGAIYGHFYEGAPGSLAVPNPATTKVESETEVASLLALHELSAFLTYQSYAITHHLAYVQLSPRVNLGNLSAPFAAVYASASTRILTASGSPELVTGAPVAFSATVPLSAPNATLGDLFVHLVLSTEGESLLASQGFTPLLPGYLWTSGPVPAILPPETVPLPAYLANAVAP